MADFVYQAFDLADKYRNPVLILADGALGQMMEKVEFPDYNPADHKIPKPWATVGKPKSRERNVITSLHIEPEKMEQINIRLQEKYKVITENETRYETVQTDDAEYLIVGYGLAARIAHGAVEMARAEGIRAGLLRPITLFPYPSRPLRALAEQVAGILVVEMNAGQMVEDVRLAVEGQVPVSFYGRMGGMIPSPDEVVHALKAMIRKDVPQREEAY
jgi:2-oxoglutarate ferredoxin oxidoreductase subunit alpha